MPTSRPVSPDSISEVATLVRNAKALQDSINRFEFLKLQIKPIKSQLQLCNESRNGLAADLDKARKANNELAAKFARSDDRAAAYLDQRNWRIITVWLLRGALLAIGYQSFRKSEITTGLLCSGAAGISFALPIGRKAP